MNDVLFESDNIKYINMNSNLKYDYIKMYTDVSIKNTLFKKIYPDEQIINWIDKIVNDKSMYSMIEKGTNDFIGVLTIIKKENNIGEIMICITPLKQGKHYSIESIKEFMKFCNIKYGINIFELYVKKSNIKAINCYKKLGFYKNGNSLTDEDIRMEFIYK